MEATREMLVFYIQSKVEKLYDAVDAMTELDYNVDRLEASDFEEVEKMWDDIKKAYHELDDIRKKDSSENE